MNINYMLAQEIYGLTPWMVDSHSWPVLSAILKNNQSGISLEIPEIKCNSVFVGEVKSDARIITRPYGSEWNPGQLDNKDTFDAVGVININGPITLNGGASSYGMEYVSNLMMTMADDDRIKGFVIRVNSGGGSSAAVEIMQDTISYIVNELGKPVNSIITKGGMAASAAYGIIAPSSKIYSESEMNWVGSTGTMIQFEGRKANTEKDGVKFVRLYATESIKKNLDIEEALNNDNYDLIINEMLDPINKRFLDRIEGFRPMLKNSNYRDGNTIFAKDGIGTFIDGIKSEKEVIGETIKQSIKIKTKNMTQAELKQSHPDVYNSVYNAGLESGVKQEQNRTSVWMAHIETDPKSVKEGILSNEPLSDGKREEFLVKASSNARLAAIATENAPVVTAITKEDTLTEEQAEAEAFYKDL